MTSHARPDLRWVLDQADAAAAHAIGMLRAEAARTGGEVRPGLPGPVTRALIARLHAGALERGALPLCEHLSWSTPAVAFWLAWAPGTLRCPACANHATQRIAGTRADATCDACRRHCPAGGSTGLAPYEFALPPVVVDLGPELGASTVPAVVVAFALCEPCVHADATPAPTTGEPTDDDGAA